MSRLPTFDREEVGAIRGLTSLTEPSSDDQVGAVVDVPVIGARGDGKTQFIVHAIRTLRAYAPVLEGTEHQYNRDVLQVVMNAREPRPEATAPGVVPHYVFRIRTRSLLAQIGGLGRLSLYARVAGLFGLLFIALLNALGVAGVMYWLGRWTLSTSVYAGAGLFVLGSFLAVAIARRRVQARRDIEIVFWDVAGEHVYSGSAADYYSFLSALVRVRRERASSSRAYAFAPVLICNPVALGVRKEGSPYARLRKLIPLFASLNEPLARAMVAINRWTVVREICAPDTDREETVGIVSRARPSDDDPQPAPASPPAPANSRPLPMVQRDVVRRHCLDAEDGVDNEVHFTYLRYDAGMQCEFRERAFADWEHMDEHARQRWRAPTGAAPARVLDYEFEDGPGSFEGEVRRIFLEWVASLAFHRASYGKPRRRRATTAEVERVDEGNATPAFARNTRARPAPEPPVRAPASSADASEPRFAEPAARERPDERSPARSPERSSARPGAAQELDAWRPRPLSATGLEDFSRGTIAPDDLFGDAIDATLDQMERGADDERPGEAPDAVDTRPRTNPGFGSVDDTIMLPVQKFGDADDESQDADADESLDADADESLDADESENEGENEDDGEDDGGGEEGEGEGEGESDENERPEAIAESADDEPSEEAHGKERRSRRQSKSDTLRMPGGFSSGGT